MGCVLDPRRHRFRWTMLVGAALAAALMLLPEAADAHKKRPPKDCETSPNVNEEGWGDACFEVDGDDMWVRDQTRNHWSVRVKVEARNLRVGYRKTRWCANTHGADSWHECKFDHREDSCVRWRMFEQSSRIPIPLNNTRKWTEWSVWTHAHRGLDRNADCYPPEERGAGPHPVTGERPECERLSFGCPINPNNPPGF